MKNNEKVGKKGESDAAQYLKKKGYRLLDFNYRQPWGELDIIAQAPDRTLVFVEVKTIGSGPFSPEENLTRAKLKKLQRTASLYANANEHLVDDSKGWRIDLVAIAVDGKTLDIRHYENI